MGDFCSQNTTTITSGNYIDSYYTVNGKSCLPNNGTGFSLTGSVSANTIINTYVSGTLSTILPAKSDPAYRSALSALVSSIQNEYCFYYSRYMFALTQVLTLAATPDTPMGSGSTYDSYKQNAIRLNNQLSQILLILQNVSRLSGASLDIDSVNYNLVDHMRKLQDTAMETDAKSAMVEYTLEKNASSRNLLAIYGFMNIVAVGMLVYLYRAA